MSSLSLQLDVGNSGIKWRLVEGAHLICRGRYREGDSAAQQELLGCAAQLDHILIASVATEAVESSLRGLFRGRWGVEPWFARSPARTGELVNSYDDPSRMGVDRWLVMLGAYRRAGTRVAVVDAGSALTIDIVSGQGRHEGGYIIPGPALMERALLLDTGRVRFHEETPYALVPGTSTAEAVRHGVAVSQVGAVQWVVSQQQIASEQLFFCGGGGDQLRHMLDAGGEFVEDLVFEGLEIMAREDGIS